MLALLLPLCTWMYVCVYIYIHTILCVCVYTYIYACMYIYTCEYNLVSICKKSCWGFHINYLKYIWKEMTVFTTLSFLLLTSFSLHFLKLFLSTFYNFQHINPINVLLDIYLSISIVLRDYKWHCFLISFFTCSLLV